MQPGRRFNLVVFGGIALACLLSAAVNTTVDPWRVTPAPWRAAGLDPYRDLSSQIRTGKAGLIRSGDWDVGLLGSSRVDNAWDPGADGWQGKRVVNLAASGGFLYETIGIARYFLAHEKPELLVIGIDPGDLTSSLDTRPLSDYGASPFSPEDRANREIRYVIGLATFEASAEVMNRARKEKLAEYTPQGLRLRPEVAASRSQMKFIRDQLLGTSREERTTLNPDKTRLLGDFLDECADLRQPVVLIFHPVHALMHAKEEDRDDPPVLFESTRRFLLDAVNEANARADSTDLIQYWDFCNFHPAHCEPLPADKKGLERMAHWNDLGHYDVELGTSVLGQALGWPEKYPEWQGQGRRITTESIDPYLDFVRRGYRDYLSGPGAADVAWKKSLLSSRP